MARVRAPWATWNPMSRSGGTITGNARKITLHTTETTGWPGYGGGGSAPHLTVNPATGEARQHVNFDRSAYALASPGAPRSPNMNGGLHIQIEIIGYAAKTPTYSDAWYKQLAEWVNWLCDEWDIPKKFFGNFGGSDGYGTQGRYRMSWSSWSSASGIGGHSNVPFNSHWDPGNLLQAKLLNFMGQVDKPTPIPPPPPPPPPPPSGGVTGTIWPDFTTHGRKDSDSVRTIQARLIELGHAQGFSSPTGNFARLTRDAVLRFQRSQGWSGDGLVGPNTLAALTKGTSIVVKSGFGKSAKGWGPAGKTHWIWSGWVFYGNKNSYSVRNLQQRLIDLGYSIPAGVTGNYYGQTKAAVEAHQRYMGLRVDGVCGPETLRSLFVEARQHYTIKWGR